MGDGDHISPWMPEQDQLRIAVLGKLAEECNELAGRAVRCLIQGIDELDPDSGRTNRAEMEREMADVIACIEMAQARLLLAADPSRTTMKYNGFARWHEMIRELRATP